MPRKPTGAAALPATIHVRVGDALLELSADTPPDAADATIAHLVAVHERARRAHASLRSQVTEVGGGSIEYAEHADVGDRAPLGFHCQT